MVLGFPQGGVILGSPNEAVITILHSDGAGGFLTFDQADTPLFVPEPEDASGPLTVNLTVNRGPGNFGRVVVYFRVVVTFNSSGHAADIAPMNGSVVLQNRETRAQVRLRVLPDSVPEVDETFTVILHSPENGAGLGAQNRRNITIRANDSPYGKASISVAGTNSSFISVKEANKVLPVVVRRSHGLTGTVSVNVEAVSDSAVAATGSNISLTTLATVRATSAHAWMAFYYDGLQHLLLLSGHRVAPLQSLPGGSGADTPYDSRRVTQTVLYRWQGALRPLTTVETDGAHAALAFALGSTQYMVIANQGSAIRPQSVTRVYRVEGPDARLTVVSTNVDWSLLPSQNINKS